MEINQPTWILKADKCSYCEVGELVFSQCPSCHVVVLICAECGTVYEIHNRRRGKDVGDTSGDTLCQCLRAFASTRISTRNVASDSDSWIQTKRLQVTFTTCLTSKNLQSVIGLVWKTPSRWCGQQTACSPMVTSYQPSLNLRYWNRPSGLKLHRFLSGLARSVGVKIPDEREAIEEGRCFVVYWRQ